jgi:hypothetical protein
VSQAQSSETHNKRAKLKAVYRWQLRYSKIIIEIHRSQTTTRRVDMENVARRRLVIGSAQSIVLSARTSFLNRFAYDHARQPLGSARNPDAVC